MQAGAWAAPPVSPDVQVSGLPAPRLGSLSPSSSPFRWARCHVVLGARRLTVNPSPLALLGQLFLDGELWQLREEAFPTQSL